MLIASSFMLHVLGERLTVQMAVASLSFFCQTTGEVKYRVVEIDTLQYYF